MLIINNKGREEGGKIASLEYINNRGRTRLHYFISWLTRWIRYVKVRKYLGSVSRHLDIGCGDGYLLRRSPGQERFGIDKLLGDNIVPLDFPGNYFDCVTMLAIIEHLPEPEKALKEVARVLKPQGRLIITTPKKTARWVFKLYMKEHDEEHKNYFDLDKIRRLLGDDFRLIKYTSFILGLNQLFYFERK